MALKTFVKISTVNNLSDARYCAGMYVDLMGFNLEENNKNFLSPEKFKEMTNWLSGLDYVAEFENTHPDKILETVKNYEGISYIQVAEEHHLQMLLNTSFGIIWNKWAETLDELKELVAKAPGMKENQVTLLLESSNLKLDEETIALIKELSSKCDVLLGFGLEAESIDETIAATQVKGIAMKGGDEIKPGLKDFDELADILESLEIED
ncbi:phosphoribosylanthranilate isomerase [Echinicola shivajiensis]|uniref:phosphoribosylanthranilate isomerase n=1 Tax=Echinicola shivajiensis TaxID=1035916 RepID=UPI001BFC85DB|nr:phosphoribosylanthranilate isomerase [Echinicola shivajiensis]